MRAMVLPRIASLKDVEEPLQLVEMPVPEPGTGQVLVRVSVCGVCHTELDEIEGRAAPSILPIVLGHEVVGRVERLGRGVTRHRPGDRVGIGWIFSSSGDLDENLSDAFQATGRDAHGGYAEYIVVPEEYAYAIPPGIRDEHAAPLLCAGAIGYRALKLAQLENGQRLGLTGFGGSAHIVLQLVRYRFPRTRVFVFARDPGQRAFARERGAVWAGDTHERSPEPLHAIIDTTPVWTPVVQALGNLRPGGRLVINAIRKEDVDKQCLLELSYHEHLWQEREIKTVANITRHDILEFLPLAAEAGIEPDVTCHPLEDANRALQALKRGGGKGARVLMID